MRFSAASLLALVGSALAQTDGFDVMGRPAKGERVSAGSKYAVTWDYTANPMWNGTVTLSLLGGADSSTLVVLKTIASAVDPTTGSYSWPVDKSLGALATYGIRITLDSDPKIFQYSFPFQITGTSTTSDLASAPASPTGSLASVSSSGSASMSKPTEPALTTPFASISKTFARALTTSATAPTGNLSVTAAPSVSQTGLNSTDGASKSGSGTLATASGVPAQGAAPHAAGSLAALAGVIAVLALILL